MKKIMLLLSIVTVGLLASAWASVEVVKGPDLSHQQIANSGSTLAHLMHRISEFTVQHPARATDSVGSIAVFKDTVNVPSMMPILTSKSKQLGATKTLDLASQYQVSGLIFYVRQVNISGNAVR